MEPITKEYLRRLVLETRRTTETQKDTEWKPYKESLKEYVRQKLHGKHPMYLHTLTEQIRHRITNGQYNNLHVPIELEFLPGAQFTLEHWWACVAVPFKMPQYPNIKATINEVLESIYGEWRRTYFPAAVFAFRDNSSTGWYTPVLQIQLDYITENKPIDVDDLLELNKPIDPFA